MAADHWLRLRVRARPHTPAPAHGTLNLTLLTLVLTISQEADIIIKIGLPLLMPLATASHAHVFTGVHKQGTRAASVANLLDELQLFCTVLTCIKNRFFININAQDVFLSVKHKTLEIFQRKCKI